MLSSETIYFLSGKFIVGVLLFIRLMGLMISGPFFKKDGVPPKMKVLFSVILATSLATAFWDEQPVIDLHLWNLIFLVFKELTIGFALGFATSVVFHAARLAGGMIDFNMGYHTSMMFSMDTSPTLVGEVLDMVTLMLFIYLNGHHFLLESVYVSVKAIPIESFAVTESTIDLLVRYSMTVFVIGIKMAAPIIIAIFLTNISLALLAKVAPQTNIFVLSFQLRIAVGLIILLVTIPLFAYVSKAALGTMETEAMKFLMTLNPGRV